LVIPHLLIVGILFSGGAWVSWSTGNDVWSFGGDGLLGALVLLAAIMLAVTGQTIASPAANAPSRPARLASVATPTVRKLQLGNVLRRLREDAGRTPAETAHELDRASSKITRIELAGAKRRELRRHAPGGRPAQAPWGAPAHRDALP
jgi:hypothetical protein